MSDIFGRLSVIDQIVRGVYQPTDDEEAPTPAPSVVDVEPEDEPPPVTGTAKSPFIDKAMAQAGDSYVWGAGRNAEPDPTGFDCSGLVYWAARQVGVNVGGTAYDQWRQTRGEGELSVEEALQTPGALLFVGDGTGTGRGAITHVAISLGDGRTIEARGRRFGVVVVDAATNARRFQFAGRIPELVGTAGSVKTAVAQAAPQARRDDLMDRMSTIGQMLGFR